MNTTSVQPGSPMLEMRGVSIASARRRDVRVVEDVNWTVGAGEFWVVAAPQHTGKTDFLMTAGGLSPPAGGEYFFLGEPMPIFDESRLGHRLKMGFVFDGGQLLGSLTLAENIALPLRYHGGLPPDEIAGRVRELLEITDLVPWANLTPASVGRSWQQRAGLARALALQPEVLLLDSPLTGLDGWHAAWWLGFLDGLSRGQVAASRGPVTLVVTADDLRPWRNHAGRVACLSGKRLLALGGWGEAEASREAVVKELLGAATLRMDRLWGS